MEEKKNRLCFLFSGFYSLPGGCYNQRYANVLYLEYLKVFLFLFFNLFKGKCIFFVFLFSIFW